VVPVPEVDRTPLHSQLVDAHLDRADAESLYVTIIRYPADARRDPARFPPEAVLVAGTAEPRRRWLELAEILIHDGPDEDAEHWIRASLTAMPGCLLGAIRLAAGRWLVAGLDVQM
jgi:hypothetical protein